MKKIKENKRYRTLCCCILFAFLIAAVLISIYFLYKYKLEKSMKEKMNITDESIVEIYNIPMKEEGIFDKVIHRYIMDEQLFFVYRRGLAWEVQPILESGLGIPNVVDLIFHQWNGEVLVEVAYSTSKGNGDVALYRLKDEKLTPLVIDKGGVDRNLDTTTNAVYENGRLFLELQENEENASFPDVILEGIEWVYGYDSPADYSGDELLYQRNLIRHVYCWDENQNEYILMESTSRILQQIDEVYPITF